MSFASGVAIYFIIWWLVLFVTLPFGIRSQHEGEDMAMGTDRGAPISAGIGRKAIATTVISLLIFATFYMRARSWKSAWTIFRFCRLFRARHLRIKTVEMAFLLACKRKKERR
tara:strand:+ start:387 stop:725 length:339 start_codon:yes stop_codon:yes gene_type:complete